MRKIAVVKFGTQVLAVNGQEFNYGAIKRFAHEIAAVKAAGWQVVVVTSGAMLVGRQQLRNPNVNRSFWPEGIEKTSIPHRQVLSCFGQAELTRSWQRSFEEYGYPGAQFLYTNDHFADEANRDMVRDQIELCINLEGVPLCNENDGETAAEVGKRFTDNDQLARLVAVTLGAARLVLLTTVDGYFADGQLVKKLTGQESWCPDESFANGGFEVSRGGMESKLENAHLAMMAGVDSYIANGFLEDVITGILLHGKNPGTFGPGRKAV